MRIAAWSGPRNVSTALMRSFEARGDCDVADEPLYAAFLAATGKRHPGREEILRSQPTDPAAALRALQAPPSRAHRYEKHMAHHWLDGFDPAWFGEARHVFLIRDPERVVASYARVREAPLPEDLGYDQQWRWFVHATTALGQAPVVVDGDELVADPEAVLEATCAALGLPWTPTMTRWSAGRRATDGVWAPHWYAAVEASTGFAPPASERPTVPEGLGWVVAAVREPWERLREHRLRP